MFEFCGENYNLKIDEKGILGGKFGGGSFWAENYNKMMTKINENRPENTAEEEGTYKIYFDETNFQEGIISSHEIKVWEM